MIFKLNVTCILIIFIVEANAGFLECDTQSDCGASDAVCVDNLCECPKGTTFNSDGTKCLPYVVEYDGDCEDDNQCGWLLGKNVCNKGKCGCSEGWTWFEGKCTKTKNLNEDCTKNSDCHNGYAMNSTCCHNKICACNDGYYLRGNYDCRPLSTEIGEECALNTDCHFDGGVCITGRCALNNGVYTKSDALKAKNTHNKYTLRNKCDDNKQCLEENTICSPLIKKCVCKRGYFYSDIEEKCVAELGVDISCKDDDDCLIPTSSCLDGACYCSKFRYNDKANRKCVKAMNQDEMKCTTNDWCYTLGNNAFCNDDNKCVCTPGYVLNEDFVCVPDENGNTNKCVDNSDCKKKNTVCRQNKCVCKENHRDEETACLPNIGAECADECNFEHSICDGVCKCQNNYVGNGTHTCLPVAGGLGDGCLESVQCSAIIHNSHCKNLTCACTDGYIQKNETCHEEKYIGAYCTATYQCNIAMNDTTCRSSKCQCRQNMVPTIDGKSCIAKGGGGRVSATLLVVIFGIFNCLL